MYQKDSLVLILRCAHTNARVQVCRCTRVLARITPLLVHISRYCAFWSDGFLPEESSHGCEEGEASEADRSHHAKALLPRDRTLTAGPLQLPRDVDAHVEIYGAHVDPSYEE